MPKFGVESDESEEDKSIKEIMQEEKVKVKFEMM